MIFMTKLQELTKLSSKTTRYFGDNTLFCKKMKKIVKIVPSRGNEGNSGRDGVGDGVLNISIQQNVHVKPYFNTQCPPSFTKINKRIMDLHFRN